MKILVTPDELPQLLDLQDLLPELDLVTAHTHQRANAVSDCDALVGLSDGDPAALEILRTGKKLRWVHSPSAGMETLAHLPQLKNRQIVLTNTAIVQGPEIADHAFALLLSLTRNLKQYIQLMEVGWVRTGPILLPFTELRGKTMLIVGLGGIGKQIAQRAKAFGMSVLGVDAREIGSDQNLQYLGRPDEVDALLPGADVVVSAVPHTPASEGMFDATRFGSMKRGVYFINVSRGKVVQTEDLLAALESGRIGAAGLDVLDPEPFPEDHPLWQRDNVVITPHIASRSDQLEKRLLQLVRDNIERFVQGRPLRNVVDRSAGY
jgi:phosphoglycerate dehydrogenase-like enzyme